MKKAIPLLVAYLIGYAQPALSVGQAAADELAGAQTAEHRTAIDFAQAKEDTAKRQAYLDELLGRLGFSDKTFTYLHTAAGIDSLYNRIMPEESRSIDASGKSVYFFRDAFSQGSSEDELLLAVERGDVPYVVEVPNPLVRAICNAKAQFRQYLHCINEGQAIMTDGAIMRDDIVDQKENIWQLYQDDYSLINRLRADAEPLSPVWHLCNRHLEWWNRQNINLAPPYRIW